MFVRNCPDCNKEVVYKTISAINFKIKHNKPCQDCSYKRRSAVKQSEYNRPCPICNKSVIHKSRVSWLRAIRNKTKCKKMFW